MKPIIYWADHTRLHPWNDLDIEVLVTNSDEINGYLTNKRTFNMADGQALATVSLCWVDPPKMTLEDGWYPDAPTPEVNVEFFRFRSPYTATHAMELHAAAMRVVEEIVDYFQNLPDVRGHSPAEWRRSRLIRKAQQDHDKEVAKAVARANDVGFTKKHAMQLLNRLREDAVDHSYGRSSIELLSRDGGVRSGSRTLYAKKIETETSKCGYRVDFSWSSYGGNRISQKQVLRIMQDEVSAAKTMAYWKGRNA